MAETNRIVQAALDIINSGQYAYGQSRAAGYLDDKQMDCSEFVLQSHRRAGYGGFSATNTFQIVHQLAEVKEPDVMPGDVVYWSGPPAHVAIVEDPKAGTFLHAASKRSGLREDSYKTNPYWKQHAGRRFFRYAPAGR